MPEGPSRIGTDRALPGVGRTRILRIQQVRIRNYRCLRDLKLDVDAITVLIGANGTGKSSVLRALKWFFEGGALEIGDVCGGCTDAVVSVEITFADMTLADRQGLQPFVAGDTATFRRTWSEEDGGGFAGKRSSYPPFEPVRSCTSAAAMKSAYSSLRTEQPSLGLPAAKSRDEVERAMAAWEGEHQNLLQTVFSSAEQLSGSPAQPGLGGRFSYVFIPAVYDAQEQTQDARGTLFQALLSRSTADHDRVISRLEEIRQRTIAEAKRVVEDEHSAALTALAERVSTTLHGYFPGGSVMLEARSMEMKMPPPQFGMRVLDGQVETDVGRQGHGFQRALLMATIHELAHPVDGQGADDPPALFFAIEEPELYQHPTQARHLARNLDSLVGAGKGAIQVAYATHNEHLIDPSRYERLRRFRKRNPAAGCPFAEVKQATVEAVAECLDGIVPREQVAKRIAITLRKTLAEAMFAHAVVLVEGESDGALLHGIADRGEGFDALGVAIIPVKSKTNLPIAWAILKELDIPTFAVFDADAGQGARMRSNGKSESDIKKAIRESALWNSRLLNLFGDLEEEWPDTRVRSYYAVFENRLETELQEQWWPMWDKAQLLAEESYDWRDKPQDCYRQAATETPGELPRFAHEIMSGIRGLL